VNDPRYLMTNPLQYLDTNQALTQALTQEPHPSRALWVAPERGPVKQNNTYVGLPFGPFLSNCPNASALLSTVWKEGNFNSRQAYGDCRVSTLAPRHSHTTPSLVKVHAWFEVDDKNLDEMICHHISLCTSNRDSAILACSCNNRTSYCVAALLTSFMLSQRRGNPRRFLIGCIRFSPFSDRGSERTSIRQAS